MLQKALLLMDVVILVIIIIILLEAKLLYNCILSDGPTCTSVPVASVARKAGAGITSNCVCTMGEYITRPKIK